MTGLTAAGGVLFRQASGTGGTEVLLIFRRGVWDLPKGKKEQKETIEECAVREVAEEIGLNRLPNIVEPLLKTYHEYEQEGVHFGKTTHWFAMQLSSEVASFTPEEKEGIERVEWYSLRRAKEMVGYDNLRDVLGELENLISKP
ncbi:8-oxo-dGTP pyrophosphatase MutT, NUDIX family [Fodinibius roseus]|uniref:8-oxo-dGTP pyrophosphatase MutT, NUDIX family n=1 Tax=Fodinibius roseus TaxID=1194090 RepID=A0A1M4ZIK0_9BACT|nr:NUDIX domain-containing protein [Fodinibius roseus]SHF17864.1 8-oxo-dGTP pyrophosphatase MutT, NUDIX family [Fodinibius roseus]